jgi:hypothetical protein
MPPYEKNKIELSSCLPQILLLKTSLPRLDHSSSSKKIWNSKIVTYFFSEFFYNQENIHSRSSSSVGSRCRGGGSGGGD